MPSLVNDDPLAANAPILSGSPFSELGPDVVYVQRRYFAFHVTLLTNQDLDMALVGQSCLFNTMSEAVVFL